MQGDYNITWQWADGNALWVDVCIEHVLNRYWQWADRNALWVDVCTVNKIL